MKGGSRKEGMSKIFTRSYRARYSDINADGQLAPSETLRYVIETAYDWAENLGLGYQASEKLGFIWVIRETEMHFFESLHFRDEFDFTIWLLEWRRVRGTRAFVVKHKDQGITIAQGVQQIACLDSNTQRPVNPPEEFIQKFLPEAPQAVPSQPFPKIPALPDSSLTLQQKVAWQDLDVMDIVNNAVYMAYAEEAVTQMLANFGWSPMELKSNGLARKVRRLHIQYHTPARWGDTLNLSIASLQLDPIGSSQYVGMTRASDGAPIASCILDWSLTDRGSGEALALPESLSTALKATLH